MLKAGDLWRAINSFQVWRSIVRSLQINYKNKNKNNLFLEKSLIYFKSFVQFMKVVNRAWIIRKSHKTHKGFLAFSQFLKTQKEFQLDDQKE